MAGDEEGYRIDRNGVGNCSESFGMRETEKAQNAKT
jgi:hypothetical protein